MTVCLGSKDKTFAVCFCNRDLTSSWCMGSVCVLGLHVNIQSKKLLSVFYESIYSLFSSTIQTPITAANHTDSQTHTYTHSQTQAKTQARLGCPEVKNSTKVIHPFCTKKCRRNDIFAHLFHLLGIHKFIKTSMCVQIKRDCVSTLRCSRQSPPRLMTL